MNAALSRCWLIGFVAAGTVVCGSGNFAIGLIDANDSVVGSATVFIWLGCLVAQIGLVAIWLGLGGPGLLARVLVALLLILTLGAPFDAGDYLSQSPKDGFNATEFRQTRLTTALTFPLVLTSIAGPLWFLRLFGWRILHRSNVVGSARRRQFSIASLLGATTCVALVLGGGVQACRVSAQDPADFWTGLAILCLVLTVVGTLLLVPAVALLSRSFMIGLFVTCSAVLVAYLAGLFFLSATLRVLIGPLSYTDVAKLAMLPAGSSIGFTATLFVAMLLMRRLGYRLVMDNSGSGALAPT